MVCLPASAHGGTNAEGKAYLEQNGRNPDVVTLPSGLQYKVLQSGQEDAPKPGKSTPCQVHYVGKLINGQEFDSSDKRGELATVVPNKVIRGWTEAMLLMKEGDRWELTIPSELAYGDVGAQYFFILGGEVLIFDVKIVKVDPDAFTIIDIKALVSNPVVWIVWMAIMAVFGYFTFNGESSSKKPGEDIEMTSDPKTQ